MLSSDYYSEETRFKSRNDQLSFLSFSFLLYATSMALAKQSLCFSKSQKSEGSIARLDGADVGPRHADSIRSAKPMLENVSADETRTNISTCTYIRRVKWSLDSFEPFGLQKAPADQTKIQTRIDINVLFLNRSNIFIRLFYT